MNKVKCCFILSSVFWVACSSPDKTSLPKTSSSSQTFLPWESSLSVEQNIAKNAIALEDNNEFSFLDSIVGNRSILLLGEGSHADYMTSIVKLKMISYLQDKGFNSIAFEGCQFLFFYALQHPEFDELTQGRKISPFLMSTKELIRDEQEYHLFIKTFRERGIKVWGMDIRCTHYDIDIVAAILSKYSMHEILPMEWKRLKDLYIRRFVFYMPDDQKVDLSVAEQYELMRMIDAISNYAQYINTLTGSNTDLKVIMQWIRNLNTYFPDKEIWPSTPSIVVEELALQKVNQLSNRSRDIQMAENINWIVKNFPDEKLMVWVANFHGAKDISQTCYPADSTFYFTMQTMGEFLYDTHGDNMYSMAFSEYRDTHSGMLENEIVNATENAPYAFINFESLRFADGYRDQEFECSVIRKKQGKWLYIFDGLYFMRETKSIE